MHVCEWPQKCYKYWFWGYQYILVSRHILDVESSNNEDWPYLLAISRATCISLCRIQSPTPCFPSSHPSLITRAALCKRKKGAPFSGWMQIYWPIPECTAWWVELGWISALVIFLLGALAQDTTCPIHMISSTDHIPSGLFFAFLLKCLNFLNLPCMKEVDQKWRAK